MRKGERTKKHIIEKSAELFNQQGYAGTSMQDIMDATGLTKGGLYRSFASKEEIATAAFQHMGGTLWERFMEAGQAKVTATDKIMSIFSLYHDAVYEPPMKGGCPFLNTAVESDASYPVLREPAVEQHKQMIKYIKSLLKQGIDDGEFNTEIDIGETASFIFSAMEGSILCSRLTKDKRHVEYTSRHIQYVLHTFKVS
ncbi:TetR/AcrR family transcriptional regulator [Longirhabdus pacifica]|uniref:TetR/AcrR family transcriptional regulator n=1 Tax=Longirhabdus pacifica TaxID=2305227 RepID=UPI001008EC42|nr:TetR/AcrR family transcriptional regulator [Longirhabdus pacifica]